MNKIKEFLKIIGVLIGISLVTFASGFVINLLGINPNNPNINLYIILISQVIYGLCAYMIIKRKNKLADGPYIKNKGFISDSWKMVFIGMGTAGFGNILISLLMQALGENDLVNQSIDIVTTAFSATSIASIIIQTILIVVIAPIVEELLFRGYVFTETKKIFSFGVAILLNGLLFGLYHMNLLQGINTFFLAMVLSTVYYYRRNITDSILVHASNNFIAILSSFIPEYASIIGVILIISIFIGAYLLYKIIKNGKVFYKENSFKQKDNLTNDKL